MTTIKEAKRTKILHFITKSNWGGAQRYVYDLAVNTPKDEFEVTVACGGNGILFKKLGEAGVRTFPVIKLKRDPSITADLLSFWEILEIIKNERPDILHLHSSKAGGLGALAGRIMRVPKIVFTAHGWPFKEERKLWQKRAIYVFSWLTSVMADRIITVSKDDEKKAPTYLIQKKIVTICPGIGPCRYRSREEARGEMFRLSGITENQPNIIIGTIAELHENKGLKYLVEAMRQVHSNAQVEKAAYLFILGEGDEYGNLQRHINDAGLADRVFLLGHIDNASEWLMAFDVFVLPSIKEGLPYTILEAGRAGLPVIATSVGGIPEIIADMSSGLIVRPKDSRDLAQAIIFLMRHPDKAETFGKQLGRKVEREFSLNRMIGQTVDVYRS